MPPPLPYPRPGASVTLRSVDAFPLGVDASVPPRTRAGTCGGLSFVLAPTFLFKFARAYEARTIPSYFLDSRLPGAGAKQTRGFFQPLAHAFHNLRSGLSNSNPRHSQAPVPVMIDHHTEGFGNVRTDFGA